MCTVGKKDKLIKRLKSKPKDFTMDELETLLSCLGYSKENPGKTSGSRISFQKSNSASIMLHKPHPQKELKLYQISHVIEVLEQEKLI